MLLTDADSGRRIELGFIPFKHEQILNISIQINSVSDKCEHPHYSFWMLHKAVDLRHAQAQKESGVRR